ncbi:hypothetical protein B0J11DRAFT_573894 [Dendryphion nanum]|uniref:Extracellular membrane protein CFEM domain-containing protein n=1 Tax=Dendryphion nanum TaxID=256645 RepID=A0A9P9I5P4_9PLEO|nr:hypothetical protein B0J11DRAFT_573894 [Dendryphion nanum]
MLFLERSLPLFLGTLWGRSLSSVEDWSNVGNTDIVQRLSPCAQKCVREANTKIAMPGTHCQSYGCVCAENTQGLNFLYGLSNVTACAQQTCPSSEDVDAASTAFQDLCLVYAANSTRPATRSGYSNLTDCAKFSLNGCLNEDGIRNEQNCGPIRKWTRWEEYQGVAAQRQCKTAECLCKQPKFDATFAVAYEAGERFCGMSISTKALPIEEYERMQNVLATYCAAEGYPPKDWFLAIRGAPPGTNLTNSNPPMQANTTSSIKPEGGKGLGAGIGLPALAAALFAAWVSWNQLALAERAESRAESNEASSRSSSAT